MSPVARTVRSALAAVAVLALVCGTASCASSQTVTGARPAPTSSHPSAPSSSADRSPAAVVEPPAIPLGRGLLAFPDAARAWVDAHPHDPRAAVIKKKVAAQPTNLWLTGDDSFGNLQRAVALGRAGDRTLLLTLWNIPLRYDGLTTPSTITLTAYETWVNRVAAMIGNTRAIVVLEPDALWFYDRLPDDASRAVRITALRYAVARLHSVAPRTRVYLDAGTSSGSVAPARMATLLLRAGLTSAAGYAVNVSSYAPNAAIQAYAQQIRRALQSAHVADPRYVVDTGRNGAPAWDNTWCNPAAQRLGVAPHVVRSTSGLDLDLWVKAPGTSDGDCGPAGAGAGSYGGEFLPAVAYRMSIG